MLLNVFLCVYFAVFLVAFLVATSVASRRTRRRIRTITSGRLEPLRQRAAQRTWGVLIINRGPRCQWSCCDLYPGCDHGIW
jgi:hypothetical protein